MTGFARSDIVGLGARLGLGSLAAELAELAEPAARIEVQAAPARLEVGGSKLGGLPDLPDDTSWPVLNDRPAVFIAQISLAEAPFMSVPTGEERPLLSLFLSRDRSTREIADAVVIPVSSQDELRPRAHPIPKKKAELLEERQVTLRPELTLPPWAVRHRSPLASLDLPELDRRRYIALLERLEAAQGLGGPKHRLLGHPKEIDDDVLVEAALMSLWQEGRSYDEAGLEAEARNWRLLVQFDLDSRFVLPFAGAGVTYFCVPARAGTAAYGRAQAFARSEHSNPGSNGSLGSAATTKVRKPAGRIVGRD